MLQNQWCPIPVLASESHHSMLHFSMNLSLILRLVLVNMDPFRLHVMYCYIIASAHDSNYFHSIHGLLRGPNFQYTSSFPVTYCFSLSLHTHYVTIPTCSIIPIIVQYPSLASFSAPLSSPVLKSHFNLVRTAIFMDQVQSLVSSPLSHLVSS